MENAASPMKLQEAGPQGGPTPVPTWDMRVDRMRRPEGEEQIWKARVWDLPTM